MQRLIILGGIGLLAAFPLAFAIIIPAVYFPVIAMLLGLVFRGVAFEFQFKHPPLRRFWSGGFCVGSAVAAFSQGAILGALIQGIQVSGRNFSGGLFDWLSPFSVVTGVALVLGYALLGASWLIIKAEGDLQSWARKKARLCLIELLGIVAVSVWTPLRDPSIAALWSTWPAPWILAPVPLATAALAVLGWQSLDRDSTGGTLCGGNRTVSDVISWNCDQPWPYAVPRHYTLWTPHRRRAHRSFLPVGTLFLLPIIIMYTAWSYWVFRGKLRHDIGYH